MEIIVILALIIINGIFAMAEIAIISAKRSKLSRLAQDGDENAKTVLDLSKNPNRFLSTIQIGITLIGILAGAFGGATVAENLSSTIATVPYLAPFSEALGLVIVVVLITYLSLVIGELVPKRIGLNNPESIARALAKPIQLLSVFLSPFVDILSGSTDALLKLFGVKMQTQAGVSEDELKMLIKEGAKIGIFEIAEKDIFERTLRLGDKRVSALMSARSEIIWLEVTNPVTVIRKKILKELHSYFPVCDGSLDKLLGVVATREALAQYFKDGQIHLKDLVRKPATVPENMPALKVLELFKKSGVHVAMVVDEYGSLAGLISLNDILEAIVGDIPSVDDIKEQEIVKRKDGSYLVDGLVTLDEIKDRLKLKKLPGEKSGLFNTVGGFLMHRAGRIPVTGDVFEVEDLRLEVLDMDGNRVDKVMVQVKKSS